MRPPEVLFSLVTILVLLRDHTHSQSILESVMRVSRQFIEDQSTTTNLFNEDVLSEYDFIVVGSGPGGATVANRLSEVPEWKVLLLEAGGEELVITDIPVIYAQFQVTGLSWGYRAQPQAKSCRGLQDRRSMWAQGKVMGGTSVINAMMYTRGHPRDYNGWEAAGNEGWGWDDVLPYFIKSENAAGELGEKPLHGKGGYLDTQYLPWHTKLADAFLDSAAERDLPLIDYNAGNMIGFSLLQVTTRNGTRCSANKAFLRSIRHRRNLHVVKNAYVTRVLVNPATKQAYGVEYRRDGLRRLVIARKEVILSAGAISTPKILMLSGVGDQEHLKSVNIPTVHHLPGVGQNLQDHVSMSGLVFLVNDTVAFVESRFIRDVRSMLSWMFTHEGPVASVGGPEALGFIRTPIAQTPPDYPDIEFIFAGAAITSDSGKAVREGIGITKDIYDKTYKSCNDKDAWTIWPLLVRQESKGTIRLKNKNPFSHPMIFANYFDVPHDLDTLVEGIKYAVEVSKTKAFQKYGSKLHDQPLPGCKQFKFASDEYWRCTAQELTTTMHHFCGTAKMGPESDPMAVVDPQLRVHGIKGLRVVDASIIPVIMAGHTAAPTYMIGEKAGDLIKREYGKLK